MVDATIERRGARDATEPDAATRLRDVIQRILEATDPQAMAAWAGACAGGGRLARRASPAGVALGAPGRYAPAIAALETLVATYPARVDERRLLASLLGRTEQWDRAIAQADAAAGIAPEDAGLHAARTAARAGWSDRGCRRDRAPDARPGAGRARRRALVDAGFARHGDAAEAAGIAAALDATSLPNARVATVAVRALLDDDRIAAAIRLGDAALEAGHDSPPLRASLAWRTCAAPPRTTARSMRWRISRRGLRPLRRTCGC